MTTRRPGTIVYELVMAVLAVATVVLALRPATAATDRAIAVIWGVFVVDYVIRLLRARARWRFIRENLPDLVAILPLGLLRAARLLRLVRVLRVVRGMAVFWRASRTLRGVLRTNELGYVMLFAAALTFAGGIIIYEVEPEIGSLPDGLWWSFVTTTTVGYGDLAPRSTEGRVLAALLMLVGIGTLSMITGSIATYFIGARRARNSHIKHIQEQLDRWDEMTPAERRQVVRMLEAAEERRD